MLAVASISLGTVLGLLEAYIFAFPITLLTEPLPMGYPTEYLAAHWLSLAVSFPVTVLVFYVIGKRQASPFRAGRSILTIFGGALLGEILGQTVFFFLPQSNPLVGFPYFYVSAPSSSLGFVFIAFSGFALSNLSHGATNAGTRGKFMLVALTSMVFGVLAGFLNGGFSLLSRLGFNAQLFGIISLLSLAIAFLGRFAVFYLIGRRVPVNGHTFAYFGLLFVGTYIGSVVGAVASVALFGQAYWTLAPGERTSNMIEGFVLVNTPPSLLVLLEALDPIASLPFLSFFAMSISRTGNTSPGTPVISLLEPHPANPGNSVGFSISSGNYAAMKQP
ncbi:MAG TPA: hypothetical protein VGR53_09985 [Nitrososphaerales archaeon]|nr:hypothetical protein [Nitrososphaerales archaeon]